MFRTTNPVPAPKRHFRVKWGEVASMVAIVASTVALTVTVVQIASDAPYAHERPVQVVVPPDEAQSPENGAQRCLDAYSDAVAGLMAAGEAGEDLTASLQALAEADNAVRFDGLCD